jgi:phosphatidylglycerophosphate synthase
VSASAHTEVGRPVGDPALGLIGQFALLAVLAAGVRLDLAGWLAGAAYAVGGWAMLTVAIRRSGLRSFGPANQITLVRAVLVGGVTALVADSIGGRAPVGVLVTTAAAALILDAVDGKVARRTGTSTALGARFDMEVDAFLILVLSVFVAGRYGAWVLAIGGMRYAYVAAYRLLPWLRRPLPPRYSAKVVAATQGVVLVIAGAGVIFPGWVIRTSIVVALGMLGWSFGRDILVLWRTRPRTRPDGNVKVDALSRTGV